MFLDYTLGFQTERCPHKMFWTRGSRYRCEILPFGRERAIPYSSIQWRLFSSSLESAGKLERTFETETA